jgi:hypothetical protein
MIQRLALYLALGLVLTLSNVTLTNWEFWAVLALFWASERMAKAQQHEQSYVEGILMFIDLDTQQQQDLVKTIRQVENKYND